MQRVLFGLCYIKWAVIERMSMTLDDQLLRLAGQAALSAGLNPVPLDLDAN
jgi:hypothetical protein